jgi:endonuclease/exonuclease/phosphatase family metal-dependent hydrolase
MDGRTLPQRAIDVLSSLNADIIALQEVLGAGPNDSGHAVEIGAGLGMGWVMASVRHLRGHQFGNVVLSHFPIRQHVQYDLSWKTCEPRCCQRVDLAIDDKTLHLFNVHLGTAYRERKDQAERLATIVHDGRVLAPKILLGDFNEWSQGLATAALTKKLQAIDLSVYLRRKRTYPGLLPFLHLDHIYHEGHVDIVGVEVPRTRKSLMASDHLPFLAELKVGFE